jgi:hypothetical protein
MAGRLFLIDADDVSQLMATAQGPRRRRWLLGAGDIAVPLWRKRELHSHPM